tara:strand:- start:105 stop:359 length:255 start_codon:yes stop_codon:yes gene_type:complete
MTDIILKSLDPLAEEAFYSEAHEAFERFSRKLHRLEMPTREECEALTKLGNTEGAYHERYERVLTAQEETWLREYGAVTPREGV